MSKVVKTLREAIKLSGLCDGMTISFHHHLRAGDTIGCEIVRLLSEMGYKNLKLAPTGLFDGHVGIIDQIRDKTITKMDVTSIPKALGEFLGSGDYLDEPIKMRTHGGRPQAMASGELRIDVAFIAVSASDEEGNCTGMFGRSAFGSLGYSYSDAMYADKVIVITDTLLSEPVVPMSINQSQVDYVVKVESIGNPEGIVARTTKITKDPVSLMIAKTTAKVIEHSGYLKDGFCFQAGAGGISLAAAQYIEAIMLQKSISGRYGLGGINLAMVSMLKKGLFKAVYDVQCFDLAAVESIRENEKHIEISASLYANPESKGCLVNGLDCVILGATEIDTNFNVNVHTDSNNCIIGGSGGHGDTAEGAKMTIITAPTFRSRVPTIVDRVNTISTPGRFVDVLVTQRGIAVNPNRKELSQRLHDAGLKVMDINDLKKETERITGVPKKVKKGKRIIAEVIGRDKSVLDEIRSFE